MNHHVQSNAAVENAFATIFSEYGEEQANEFRDQATLLIEPAPTGKSTADAGESAITLQRIPQSERPDLASPAGKSTRSAATRCTVYPSSLAAYQASLREHASAWIRPWWHYALALVWLGIFSYGVIGLWSSETAPQAPTASAASISLLADRENCARPARHGHESHPRASRDGRARASDLAQAQAFDDQGQWLGPRNRIAPSPRLGRRKQGSTRQHGRARTRRNGCRRPGAGHRARTMSCDCQRHRHDRHRLYSATKQAAATTLCACNSRGNKN